MTFLDRFNIKVVASAGLFAAAIALCPGAAAAPFTTGGYACIQSSAGGAAVPAGAGGPAAAGSATGAGACVPASAPVADMAGIPMALPGPLPVGPCAGARWRAGAGWRAAACGCSRPRWRAGASGCPSGCAAGGWGPVDRHGWQLWRQGCSDGSAAAWRTSARSADSAGPVGRGLRWNLIRGVRTAGLPPAGVCCSK